MTDEIMTLKELADYLKIAEKTLYLYAREGRIPAIKIGSAWRFRRADIDGWLEKQRQVTRESTSKRNQGAKRK
jgi:excisionase family DNA binding protein